MVEQSFQIKDVPFLLKATYKEWSSDDPWRLSAVVAYYAIFSLPALLIIVITIAGNIYGQQAVQGEISSQINSVIGPQAAKEVENMISNAYSSDKSTFATIVGIATLVFGATGVFYQLQQSLNIIWDVEPDENSGFKKIDLMKTVALKKL